MKCTLHIKMVSILSILVSIDFIYSGCNSCRAKGSNGGGNGGNGGNGGKSSSKTNATGSQGNGEKPLTKPEIGDIKTAIEKYMNNMVGNRTGLTGKWVVEIASNGLFIIKCGSLFNVTVVNGEIEKLTTTLTTTQIKNIECTMEMICPSVKTKYTFANNGKCRLVDLIESLSALDRNFRKFTEFEYLYVTLTGTRVGKGHCVYINLSNGIMYGIEKLYGTDYIARVSSLGGKLTLVAPYLNGGIFYIKNKSNMRVHTKPDEASDTFNIPSLKLDNKDIEGLTLTLKTL